MANGSDMTLTADPNGGAAAPTGLVSGIRSFAAGHGGATAVIEYVGRRGARIVLIDEKEVRALMTGSWLRQMGFRDVFVLAQAGELLGERGGGDGGGHVAERGAGVQRPELGRLEQLGHEVPPGRVGAVRQQLRVG